MSVPNQYVLTINKGDLAVCPPFLMISDEDWQEAFINLTRSAFGVYLLLARNANGYQFEYSPRAIENAGLMAHGTATKARQELEEKGYIENNVFYVYSKRKREGLKQIKGEIEGRL